MLSMNPPVSYSPVNLGAELVRLRTDAHLSQRALARYADVSNTAISAIENGDAPAPHPSMLAKLAQGLATSGHGLVDEERSADLYLALMRAAGYVPLETKPDDDALLRRLIEQRIGNRANAELTLAVLEQARGRPAADQETILNVFDVLLRSLKSRDD